MRREKPLPKAVEIADGRWKRVLTWEDEPVLTLELRWPRLPEEGPGLRRVDRYYRREADQWRARWEGPLYEQAKAAAQAARARSHPFRPWEAALDYHVTLRQDGLLSLYTDAYEYAGGAHGVTVRRGGAWELPSGAVRTLRSCFPPRCRWRRLALEQVARQIEARLASGESWFDADWREKLPRAFDPERFYLTEEGPAVFFPLYSIAPYAEGIPVFPLTLPGTPEPNRPEPD